MHEEGARGWGYPQLGVRGAPPGRRWPGQPGRSAGYARSAPSPRPQLGGGRAERMRRAQRSATGGQELPQPLPGAGRRRGKGCSECHGGGRVGRRAGSAFARSSTTPAHGAARALPRNSGAALSPLAVPVPPQPAGRARSLPWQPDPLPATSPLRAGRELIPGPPWAARELCPVLWRCSDLLRSPPGLWSPPPPARMQGRRLGSGDGLMLSGEVIHSSAHASQLHVTKAPVKGKQETG